MFLIAAQNNRGTPSIGATKELNIPPKTGSIAFNFIVVPKFSVVLSCLNIYPLEEHHLRNLLSEAIIPYSQLKI
jgi:hypothetical protein